MKERERERPVVVVAVAAGGCSEVASSVENDFALVGFRVLGILLKLKSLRSENNRDDGVSKNRYNQVEIRTGR